MKTERGYIVAMHKLTNKIVTISLEMWDLIENIDDYKPLYRADDKKDAENYVKEISSNIQKEPTMVNKQELIEKIREMLYAMLITGGINNYEYVTAPPYDSVEEFVNDFCKAMEEE